MRPQFGNGECQGLRHKLTCSRSKKSCIKNRDAVFNKLVQRKRSGYLVQMSTNLHVVDLLDTLTIDREDQLEEVCFDHRNFCLLKQFVILHHIRLFRCPVLAESSLDQTGCAYLERSFQKVEVVELINRFGLILKF